MSHFVKKVLPVDGLRQDKLVNIVQRYVSGLVHVSVKTVIESRNLTEVVEVAWTVFGQPASRHVKKSGQRPGNHLH